MATHRLARRPTIADRRDAIARDLFAKRKLTGWTKTIAGGELFRSNGDNASWVGLYSFRKTEETNLCPLRLRFLDLRPHEQDVIGRDGLHRRKNGCVLAYDRTTAAHALV
jgi:hypothetical protein